MDEIRKIPLVTRSLIGGVLLVTLPCLLKLMSAYNIVFIPSLITSKFEVWRIVTSFLYGGEGIALLFDVFLIFRNSSDLEERCFMGRTADYAYALILIAIGIMITNIPLNSVIFFRPLLMALSHLWAQNNPTSSVSLFGLIQMKAPYFLFALVGLELIQGGPIAALRAFTGLACAHLYYFLTTVYPAQNGGTPLSFLSTPQFLIDYLGNGLAPTPPPGNTSSSSTYRTGGGHAFRASGNALGSGSNTGTLRGGAAPVAPAGGTAGASGTTAREARGPSYRWGSGNRLGE